MYSSRSFVSEKSSSSHKEFPEKSFASSIIKRAKEEATLRKGSVVVVVVVGVLCVREVSERERERRDGTERELRREKALFARELFLRLARVYSERERERGRGSIYDRNA